MKLRQQERSKSRAMAKSPDAGRWFTKTGRRRWWIDHVHHPNVIASDD